MSYWTLAATLIKRHEGYRDEVYLCPAGARTIGWGHNIDAHPLPEEMQRRLDAVGRITTADAEALLDADMQGADRDCRRLFPGFEEFTDNRKAALVDWLFNLGLTRARTFQRSVHLMNRGLWEEAADAMMDSRWYRQLGGDPPGTDDKRVERPETIVGMIAEG